MMKLLASICLVAMCLLGTARADDTTAADGGAGANAGKIDIDADNFVEGNLYFVLYHELGHAMVSEFDIAVVGKEEDAVDGLATDMLTPDDHSEPPNYLKGAIKGWFLFGSMTKLSEIPWWDEHSTDAQRAFRIACLLYGDDADHYKDIADAVNLPDNRRASCVHESDMNSSSWESLLAESKYKDGEKPADDSNKPEVVYEATEKYQAQEEYLKKLGILEDIASYMHEHYKFKPGIKLVAKDCGQINAFWNRGDRTLTLCYEISDAYHTLAKNIDSTPE